MTPAAEFGKLPSRATGNFRPFTVNVSEEQLQNLQSLLKLCPITPATYENCLADGHLGVRRHWILEAVDNWKTTFNWRQHEKYINSFPAYTKQIMDDDGRAYTIHFAALFSKKVDATPLLMIHGWPGSFLEFFPIFDLLREKYTPESLPYHVVVPSLPGYAFSSPPPVDRDFRLQDAARLLNTLILSLGFSNGYFVQGGDVGSRVARIIAVEHEACRGIHINYCIMSEPVNIKDSISEAEKEGLERANDFKKLGTSYAVQQATRPSTIGFALQSSPIALLAWIGEKFLTWTDETPELTTILESVSLYWFTGCAATCMWPQRQIYTPGVPGIHDNPAWRIPCGKPLGYSWFPREVAPIPRAWVATTVAPLGGGEGEGELFFHRAHSRGGHFAALERPMELLGDVEEFIGRVIEKMGF